MCSDHGPAQSPCGLGCPGRHHACMLSLAFPSEHALAAVAAGHLGRGNPQRLRLGVRHAVVSASASVAQRHEWRSYQACMASRHAAPDSGPVWMVTSCPPCPSEGSKPGWRRTLRPAPASPASRLCWKSTASPLMRGGATRCSGLCRCGCSLTCSQAAQNVAVVGGRDGQRVAVSTPSAPSRG